MSSPPIELLTVEEAFTALRVSRTTLNRLLSCGALQRVKVGSRTLITRASVDAFLETVTEVRND